MISIISKNISVAVLTFTLQPGPWSMRMTASWLTGEADLEFFWSLKCKSCGVCLHDSLGLSRWFMQKFYLCMKAQNHVLTLLPKGSCCTQADFLLLFLWLSWWCWAEHHAKQSTTSSFCVISNQAVDGKKLKLSFKFFTGQLVFS